jgi:hypothetical protein
MLLFESADCNDAASIPQQSLSQKGPSAGADRPPARAFFVAVTLTMAKISLWWISVGVFLDAFRRALLPSSQA